MSFKAWTSPLFALFVSSKCEINLSQTPILFLRDTHSRKGRVYPFCVHIHKYIKKKKKIAQISFEVHCKFAVFMIMLF